MNGTMLAEHAEDVVTHLRTRALFITSVARANSPAGRIASLRALGGISLPPLLAFFRCCATLTRAGVSLSRSLSVSASQCTDIRLREALGAILADIEQGSSLSAALRKHPREFSPLHIAMVEAGETGGMLDDVLERLATLLEREQAMRKKLGAALAYPLIVLTSAAALVAFLLSTLLPIFGRLFAQLGVEQPPSTRFLLLLGELARQPFFWFCSLLTILSVLALLALGRSDPRCSILLDRIRLHLPLFGTMHRKIVIARLTRTLGALLHAGVDVLRALEVVAPVTGNAAYNAALRQLHDALRNGDSIAEQLERSNDFEPMVLQMIRVGEETGTLDMMLLKTADYYDADIDALAATLNATLEPLLILIVGSIVGFIVFSIFVPMYSLVSQIR